MPQDSLSPQSKPTQPDRSDRKPQTPEKQLVRSELNLEQNSVFTVSAYRKKSREVMVREVLPTGEVSERKAIIGKTIDGIETGVLTTHHFKTYLALLELWEQAARPINEPVHFTILRIIKCLGMKDSGEEYERVKKWLYQLRQIPLEFRDSFFVPKEESFASLKPFTILSYLDIYEREYQTRGNAQRTRGYGGFQFDRHILENLIVNHSHPLRLDVIRKFKKHKDSAILLYTYLDRCLAFKDTYEINLEKLFEHLDLSQRHVRYPAKRKQVIDPVLKELEDKPLSTGILSYCRIQRTKDGQGYKLIAHKKPFGALLAVPKIKPQELTPPQATPRPGEPELVNKLFARGLTGHQARELLSTGEQVITVQLEALPYRLSRYRRQGKPANEAAILYRSIKENWTPPKSYWQAKEREEHAKRRAEEREHEHERQQQLHAEQARRAQEYTELMAYYATLSPAEQKAIDGHAMAQLSPFTKNAAQRLKVQGKNPLESISVKVDFDTQRYKILSARKGTPLSDP